MYMKNRFDHITEDALFSAYNIATSIENMCEILNLPKNGTSHRGLNNLLKKYNLDKSVFKMRRYEQTHLHKVCPICKKSFDVRVGQKPKITCSYSCANKMFRTGKNNWRHKHTIERIENGEEIGSEAYQRICFSHHGKKCVVCGESKIVSVHHFNGNHSDNSPENLVPLCPTHHQYMHSRYKNEIIGIIENHIENFKRQHCLGPLV